MNYEPTRRGPRPNQASSKAIRSAPGHVEKATLANFGRDYERTPEIFEGCRAACEMPDSAPKELDPVLRDFAWRIFSAIKSGKSKDLDWLRKIADIRESKPFGEYIARGRQTHAANPLHSFLCQIALRQDDSRRFGRPAFVVVKKERKPAGGLPIRLSLDQVEALVAEHDAALVPANRKTLRAASIDAGVMLDSQRGPRGKHLGLSKLD